MKKKLIIGTLLLIIIAIVLYFLLFNKKVEEDNNYYYNLFYVCEKELRDYKMEYKELSCKYKVKFEFSVDSNSNIDAASYIDDIYFQNNEDMHSYFEYMSSIYMDSSIIISEDNLQSMVRISNSYIYGGVKTFSNDYLDMLSSRGFKCIEQGKSDEKD